MTNTVSVKNLFAQLFVKNVGNNTWPIVTTCATYTDGRKIFILKRDGKVFI